jgi:hypothetical protein
MSIFKRVFPVVSVLMLLAACGGIPVSTDYEPDRDYSSLKTYAWKEPMRKIIIDPLLDNDLMSDRIHREVDARLTALGYSKALADEGADFFITFNISSADKISVDSYYGYYGYHSCWNCYGYRGYGGYGGGRDVRVRQYTLGALMLDVIDPASERLIWRGVGEKRIPKFKTPQERDLYIAEIVQAILDRFPPGKLTEAT